MKSHASRTSKEADLAKTQVLAAIRSFSTSRAIIILGRAMLFRIQYRAKLKINRIIAKIEAGWDKLCLWAKKLNQNGKKIKRETVE